MMLIKSGLELRWLAASWRHRAGGLAAVLAVLGASGAPVQAAETILLNESPAYRCYLSALRGADAREIDDCDVALAHQSLSQDDRAATLSNRGLLLSRSGRLDEALVDQNRAIEQSPGLLSLYINRANTHTRARQYDAAMTDLDLAIRLGEGDPDAVPVEAGGGNALSVRGDGPGQEASAAGGQVTEGASSAEAGLASMPVSEDVAPQLPQPDVSRQLAVAFYNRALLFHRTGALDEALADVGRAAALAPDREIYRHYAQELQALRQADVESVEQ